MVSPPTWEATAAWAAGVARGSHAFDCPWEQPQQWLAVHGSDPA